MRRRRPANVSFVFISSLFVVIPNPFFTLNRAREKRERERERERRKTERNAMESSVVVKVPPRRRLRPRRRSRCKVLKSFFSSVSKDPTRAGNSNDFDE